jgi:hypothetical protein
MSSYFRILSVVRINIEWINLKFGVGGSSNDIKSITTSSFVEIGKMGKKIKRRHNDRHTNIQSQS